MIDAATYRMLLDSSVASLLRLAHRIDRRARAGSPAVSTGRGDEPSLFGQLLRGAFLSEVDRAIEELGALSGIDGAVLLNRDLALVAFGVILPVGHVVPIERAIDSVGGRPRVLPVSRRVLAPRTAVRLGPSHGRG